MSYRQLRNFIEILTSLGYPDTVSVEDFRLPNFYLVSKLLAWLVGRYQPSLDIPFNISTEDDRIIFLKSIAREVYNYSKIKLKLKKLYQADGNAVKELLKIAKVLNEAKIQYKNQLDGKAIKKNTTAPILQIKDQDFQQKIAEIRRLSNELTKIGSELYINTENEVQNHEERYRSIAQPHKMDEIKEEVKNLTEDTKDYTEELKRKKQKLEEDEEDLKKKKKSRLTDLERANKRYARVFSHPDPFLKEYTMKEKQLQELFQHYVQKTRNLDFLESQLEKYTKRDEKVLEELDREIGQNANRGDNQEEEEIETIFKEQPSPAAQVRDENGKEMKQRPGVAKGETRGGKIEKDGKRRVNTTPVTDDEEEGESEEEGEDSDEEEGESDLDEEEGESDLDDSEEEGEESDLDDEEGDSDDEEEDDAF